MFIINKGLHFSVLHIKMVKYKLMYSYTAVQFILDVVIYDPDDNDGYQPHGLLNTFSTNLLSLRGSSKLNSAATGSNSEPKTHFSRDNPNSVDDIQLGPYGSSQPGGATEAIIHAPTTMVDESTQSPYENGQRRI